VLGCADEVFGGGDGVPEFALGDSFGTGVVAGFSEEVIFGDIPAINFGVGIKEGPVFFIHDGKGHVFEKEHIVFGETFGAEAADVAVGHVDAIEENIGDDKEGELAGFLSGVAYGYGPDFAGVIAWYKNAEFDLNPILESAEDGVPETIGDFVGIVIGESGEVASGPEFARFLIADIDGARVFAHVLLAKKIGNDAGFILIERTPIHAVPRTGEIRWIPHVVKPISWCVWCCRDVFETVCGVLAVVSHVVAIRI